jgi:hypothetical protein
MLVELNATVRARHSGMVRQHQTSGAQLRTGEFRDSSAHQSSVLRIAPE